MNDATATTDKTKRSPPISAKVKEAINLLVAGDAKTVTAAAEKAGISREHLSREISRPHIMEYFRSKVLRNLAVASARAGHTKVMLLDSDNEMVRDRASSFILGLIGINPNPQGGSNVIISPHGQAGYVIDLTDGPTRPGLQIVVRERVPAQEEARTIDVTPNPAPLTSR